MAKHGPLKKPGSRRAASSYGTTEKRKGDRWKPGRALSQEEHVSMALARYRAAVIRSNSNPDDVALRLAVESRRKEWRDEQYALEQLNQRRA